MPRVVSLLAGLVIGFAAGSVLSARLIASAAGPTPVAWDASSCAPGSYTITVTARSLAGPETYVTTASNVKLPQPVFVQEFPNLPPGDYSVVASGRARHGRAFESAPQTVSGLGAWITVGTRGHRSPLLPQPAAAQAANALAVPPAAAAPHAANAQASLAVVAAAPAPSAAAHQSDALAAPVPPATDWLLRVKRGDSSELMETDIGRCRVELLDLDGDGLADAASIEWIGPGAWIRLIIELQAP